MPTVIDRRNAIPSNMKDNSTARDKEEAEAKAKVLEDHKKKKKQMKKKRKDLDKLRGLAKVSHEERLKRRFRKNMKKSSSNEDDPVMGLHQERTGQVAPPQGAHPCQQGKGEGRSNAPRG